MCVRGVLADPRLWNCQWAGECCVIEAAAVVHLFKAAITWMLSWCLKCKICQTPLEWRVTRFHRMQLIKTDLPTLVKNQQKCNLFLQLHWTTRDKIKLCTSLTCPHMQNVGALPSLSLGHSKTFCAESLLLCLCWFKNSCLADPSASEILKIFCELYI